MRNFDFDVAEALSPTVPIYTVYRDAAWWENITTTPQTLSWDTEVSENIAIPAVSGDTNFDLSDGGHYLIMYSIPVISSGWNDRSEALSWLRLDDTTDQVYGRASSYIRRIDGDSDGYHEWAAILDVAAGTDVGVQIQKTDTHNATIQRTPWRSGINILKLDDAWNYARLRLATNQTVTTSWQDVGISIEDELDTVGFTRAGDDLTLIDQWHYLVTYNAWVTTTSGDRTNNELRLTLWWTEIEATRTSLYVRWQQWWNDGVASYVGIIETTAPNQILNLQVQRESTTAWANNLLQTGSTGLTIAKIPDSADYVRIWEAIWGQDMTTTTNTAITFDTSIEEDTASFDHDDVNREEIGISQDGDYMFLHNVYNDRSGTANGPREAPFLEWELDGIALEYGTSWSYNRQSNDGNPNSVMNSSSSSAGIIIPNLTSANRVELVETNEAANGSAVYSEERIWVQWVNLDTLFTAKPLLAQQHFRFRDDSVDLDTDSSWLAWEDTEISGVEKWATQRLRISLANAWQLGFTSNAQYSLEWWDAVWWSCNLVTTWNDFDSTNDAWEMRSSANITPNEEISTTPLLANTESFSFIDTRWYDGWNALTSIVPGNTMTAWSYREFEFSIAPTVYAVTGNRYCFRLYDTLNIQELDLYNYASLRIDDSVIPNTENWWEAWSIAAPANGWWTTVSFLWGPYINPVIVWRPNTQNDPNEALVFESRNITSTWADVRLCDSNAGNATWCQNHLSETIWYIVVDADKSQYVEWVEAGTFTVDQSFDTGAWLIVTSYEESFLTTPYVFTAIQSTNGDSPIVTRVSASSPTTFSSGICQQNSQDWCNASHPSETLWWIAIEPWANPFWNLNDIGTGLSNAVSNIWTSVVFWTAFTTTPSVISQTVTNLWGQDAQIDEIQSVTTLGMDFRSCELDSNDDDCDGHAVDTVRWFAIEPGVFTQTATQSLYLDKTHYRWYENIDSITPSTALASENIKLSALPANGQLRLRMLLQNGVDTFSTASKSFKLQYVNASVCEWALTWTDVWASWWWSEDWLMFDNPTTVTGSPITSSLLFWGTHILQNYSETNPTNLNSNSIAAWFRGEWDFSIVENGIPALSEYCFRVVSTDDEEIHYGAYAQIDLVDTEDPVISSFTPASWALLPIGNFDITYDYSDSESGINTSSGVLSLQKWNGTIWETDISGTYTSLTSLTLTWAVYETTWLPFGRYRAWFSISDNAGNIEIVQHEFYVDAIEFTISTPEVDIGSIYDPWLQYTSSWMLTVEVKTVGVAFNILMTQQTDMQNTPDIIPDWDGIKWFWYEPDPFGTVNAFGTGNIIWSENRNLHPDGEKYTYSYDLKYSVLLDILENYSAWDYESLLDFEIQLDYN